METIINYFSSIPSEIRTLILIIGIVVFWVFEGVLPLFSFQYKKIRHAGINLLLTLIQLIIGLFFAGLLIEISKWTVTNNFGILNLTAMPLWVKVILGIMILDFVSAYVAHWVGHKVKFLWKFHVVHHTDTNVDVTTGLRHHPGETFVRLSFTLLGVAIVGAPIGIVMLYQSLSIFFAHLTHANINTEGKLDDWLSYIFVTPNMHKVHHHYKQPFTDTNYGNIFSLWDRLFGTFATIKKAELVYGVDTHPLPEENDDLINLFKIPFQPYRSPTGREEI